jgi:hypothetical protein
LQEEVFGALTDLLAFLQNSRHRQGEVQDLEGDLGLVLGVEREFPDGFAEMGERRIA